MQLKIILTDGNETPVQYKVRHYDGGVTVANGWFTEAQNDICNAGLDFEYTPEAAAIQQAMHDRLVALVKETLYQHGIDIEFVSKTHLDNESE